jgi:hypothetical protein
MKSNLSPTPGCSSPPYFQNLILESINGIASYSKVFEVIFKTSQLSVPNLEFCSTTKFPKDFAANQQATVARDVNRCSKGSSRRMITNWLVELEPTNNYYKDYSNIKTCSLINLYETCKVSD